MILLALQTYWLGLYPFNMSQRLLPEGQGDFSKSQPMALEDTDLKTIDTRSVTFTPYILQKIPGNPCIYILKRLDHQKDNHEPIKRYKKR